MLHFKMVRTGSYLSTHCSKQFVCGLYFKQTALPMVQCLRTVTQATLMRISCPSVVRTIWGRCNFSTMLKNRALKLFIGLHDLHGCNLFQKCSFCYYSDKNEEMGDYAVNRRQGMQVSVGLQHLSQSSLCCHWTIGIGGTSTRLGHRWGCTATKCLVTAGHKYAKVFS